MQAAPKMVRVVRELAKLAAHAPEEHAIKRTTRGGDGGFSAVRGSTPRHRLYASQERPNGLLMSPPETKPSL